MCVLEVFEKYMGVIVDIFIGGRGSFCETRQLAISFGVWEGCF